jgi:uncharacterized protein (TIGR03083 family)
VSNFTWTDVWAAVHEERRALLSDLAALPAERWEEASLCPGWSVHDVVAHLIDAAKTTRTGFVRRMVSARFDFDRDNDVGIAAERRATPTDTLAKFESVLTSTATPPAARETRLVEAIVHGEDVRRPLGLRREYPLQHVLPALRHQLSTRVSMGGGRERAAGFRLVADDADLAVGAGPEVRASALALLLAVSGRPLREGELRGPGASAFARRIRGV